MAAGLQTLISLDQLHCLKMSEFGTAEPYAWTAFFKIDGDTVQVDLADDGRPGLFLTGVCTFLATPGSHGDLRDRSVAEGDDVPIPAELGEVRLPLTPMRATQRTMLPADFSAPGTVGVVVALLEENLASDAGAAAGRQAFNRAVEQGINDLIPTLGMSKRKPAPEDIKDLITKVGNAVHDAVEGAQGVGRNILSFFDGDQLIDAHVFTADSDALAATPTQQIDARFQRLQDAPFVGPEIVDDYRLTGEIAGIPAGPLAYEAVRRSAEFGSIMPDGAPPAAGDPVAYLDPTHGTNLVIYRGTDRNIHSLYWSGSGSVGHDELSQVAGTPPAAGDPAAYYTAGDDVHQIVYRTADGSLHELWWAGNAPVSGWSVTGAAPGAPPAASDPAAYYSPGANTKHIIYRSADNHLHELSWVPGTATPGHVDLTVSALARSAAGRPAAYVFERSDTAHLEQRHVVVYRSTDNEIREIRWTTGGSLIFTG